MSEQAALPPPEPQDEPPPARPTGLRLFPWLTALGFLILALALVWVWQHPTVSPPDTERADALAKLVGALEERMARLEQRPSPQTPDLGPLTTRVATLEQRQRTPTPQAASVDLGPLEARIAALEAKPPADSQSTARLDALENAQRTMQTDLLRRLDADEARFAAAAKSVGRMAQVQAAKLALDAGQKLGELPGAPPALLRFATTNPPTEAELRLAFPQAARDALAASRPMTEGKPLLARLWAQAQDLVTISRGDRVLIGDPASGVLDRAEAALDAGDLAAAVAALDALQGPAAHAMSGWLAQAHALLEARAALATWAANG